MFQTLKAETVVPHAVPVLNKPGDVLHDVPVLNKPEVVPASTSSTPPSPTGNHAMSERTSNPGLLVIAKTVVFGELTNMKEKKHG